MSDGVPGWAVPAAILYMGVWSTALTVLLTAKVFKRLPAVDAALILSSEPLWATVIAAALLGTVISPTDYAGGALIICALACSEGLLPFSSDGDEADE